jgi:quinolinate synthase
VINEATVEATLSQMSVKLERLVPAIEMRHKAELVFEIQRLKRERRAIILGHNYMEASLYNTVADYTGDSLELSRISAKTDAEVILFCGVVFMAETAKILNPNKTVLIPSLRAGCSLASSITADDVRDLRRQYPGVPIITYVNSYADVKAESDACCTSGNAAAVVESFKTDTVIFLPDEFLAKNVAHETGKEVIFPVKGAVKSNQDDGLNRKMIAWRGRCEVHEQFSVEDIRAVRQQFPEVVVLSHPECSPEVVGASDFSGSTRRMIDFVRQHPDKQFLILTECAMGDNIIAENPKADVLRMCSIRCPHMNLITLEQTRDSLKHMQFEVHVEESIRLRAKKALDYMLSIG